MQERRDRTGTRKARVECRGLRPGVGKAWTMFLGEESSNGGFCSGDRILRPC